jgi:hypothetical protein
MENLVKRRTYNLQQRTLELEEERARAETLLKGDDGIYAFNIY